MGYLYNAPHRIFSTAALTGLRLYYAQLALNLAWTPLFFGLKQVGSSVPTYDNNRGPAHPSFPLSQITVSLVDIVTLTGTVYYMTVLNKVKP